MPYELIITEKPQAAKKIAEALADSKVSKYNMSGVPYYEISSSGKRIVIGCAVGHLYTMSEKKKGKWEYPIFNVEWRPINEVNKNSKFSAKYLQTIKKLSKDANIFTVACDYDIEGEVIGYNIIRFVCKQSDARRMKFSTLTKEELKTAFNNVSHSIDWGLAKAGLTRHELDWYYGINLSRALSLAVKSVGSFKILSSGRVQGPALKIIVDREKEISAFIPTPYWQIELQGESNEEHITAFHIEDKFWEKQKADAVLENTRGQDGTVSSVERNEFNQAPPPPFDLTTLQTEAYRALNIQPKQTLEIAQDLYVNGFISYPRTSSQKLPTINFRKVLSELAKQKEYAELINKLLAKTSLKPREGDKTDPAHPAIYPTGIKPTLTDRKKAVYDLIVKRFLACFAEPAMRETVLIKIDVNKEIFVAKGTRTTKKGWHEYYAPYVPFTEQELPMLEKNQFVKVKQILLHNKETQPPKRYTPASIIKELEKRNLGTKATRAAIIDNLYQRGYLSDVPIRATPLGINTCEILEKYSPKILDEELTRHFEDEMELIRIGKITPEKVLSEARQKLIEILEEFRKNEKEIGEGLLKANIETRNIMMQVGQCPVCKKGILEIRQGKYGRFVACNMYPDCETTFNLPNTGTIKATQQICEQCKHPMIQISRGKKPQVVCINNRCPKKMNEHRTAAEKKGRKEAKIQKTCPKCGGPLVVRRSVYGEFIGCSKFPRCKHTEKIDQNTFTV
ncbi:MAG: DNA topoisomerase I [Candidatus Woesearchaeota archaeon]